MMKTRLSLPLSLFLTLIFSACAPTMEESASTAPPPAAVPPTIAAHLSSTHPTADGQIDFISNSEIRFLPTQSDLSSANQIDIPLPGKPAWVAGIPYEGNLAWAVALEDGSLFAYSVNHASGYAQVAISPEKLPPGAPLTIYAQGESIFALTTPGTDASPFTPPVLLDPDLSKIAYIATDGDLVIWAEGQETRLHVNALPDGRILKDEHNRLLFLSNPTERYTHGVLGDSIEATGITLVQISPEPKILRNITIPEPDVIEGIFPTWADLNNDGQREIIVTLSNAQEGARIVTYREDGNILAEGSPIGTGYRWRHQLVAAPFDESGGNLLAVVRTPHIGGVVEFYRLNGSKLEIVTEIPGISTHSIGSRNLFTAQAGDFDNDGQVELLAPDQSHTRLGILNINGNPITWLDLGAELTTNLAAVTFDGNNQVAIAAGLFNNSLRVWLP